MSRRRASFSLWLSGLEGFETFQCCVDGKCRTTYVRHIRLYLCCVQKLNATVVVNNGNRHDCLSKSSMRNKTKIELCLTFFPDTFHMPNQLRISNDQRNASLPYKAVIYYTIIRLTTAKQE